MDQQFIVISAAQQRKLVRVSDIQEIVPLMALAEVDEVRSDCRGMANLRGQIIPVFDLNGADAALAPSRFVLVSRVEGSSIGLIVDEIHDVVTVPEAQLAPRPVGGGRSVLVTRIGNDVLAVLEPCDALGHAG